MILHLFEVVVLAQSDARVDVALAELLQRPTEVVHGASDAVREPQRGEQHVGRGNQHEGHGDHEHRQDAGEGHVGLQSLTVEAGAEDAEQERGAGKAQARCPGRGEDDPALERLVDDDLPTAVSAHLESNSTWSVGWRGCYG
ncbi:MAG: hypothetical protein ACYS5W_23000 [Planctomycetota bacterium]